MAGRGCCLKKPKADEIVLSADPEGKEISEQKVLNSEGLECLKGFQLNSARKVSDLLYSKPEIIRKGLGDFALIYRIEGEHLKAPSMATHFRLLLALICWSPESGHYETKIRSSSPIPIHESGEIRMELGLEPVEGSSLLLISGIYFCLVVNSGVYNSMNRKFMAAGVAHVFPV